MNASQLNQLPYLCVKKIVNFLSLRDLVKCRTVSRWFKFYADQAATEIDRLVVTDDPSEIDLGEWHRTNKRIDADSSVHLSAFLSTKSSPFKLNQQLRFLYIDFFSESWDFGILNDFKQLVQLEIVFSDDLKPKTLSLPNLKVFVSHCFRNDLFVLKAPKLEILVCCDLEDIQVEHPETIKRLECFAHDSNQLANLKSLEVLVRYSTKSNLSQIFDLLSNSNSLKELDIDDVCLTCEGEYEEFRSSLVNLMSLRTALKREELSIYLREVLLTDPKQLPNRHKDINCLFWFKNYRMLRCDSYPEVTHVNFNDLMNLDFELANDFFGRFPQIQCLTATGPVDRDDFAWFVQHASALRRLSLTDTTLNQSDMNNLPNISRLTDLNVFDRLGLITDFNFILRFEQLQSFETDRQFNSPELVEKAFWQLTELEHFEFRAGYEAVNISRFKDDYKLAFSEVKDNRKGGETFCRDKLKWDELVALCDQRKAAPSNGRARIDRSK